MQSLGGMAHFDFNAPGAYAYEQAFQVMRRLRLPYPAAEQQYRRMVFNVVARNQDDHPKNIAFLMDPNGAWRLSPAYDVTYAHNPAGRWTHQHQMSVNGKRDNFTCEDLFAVGDSIGIRNPRELVAEVVDAIATWPEHANAAGVPADRAAAIAASHRLDLRP